MTRAHYHVCETMFTVGESREISHANDTEKQAQQRWIHQMAGNPRRGRFPTETPLERELRLEIQSEQLRGRRQQETGVEQREYRFSLRRRSR